MPNELLVKNGFYHVHNAFQSKQLLPLLIHIESILANNDFSQDFLYENNSPKKLLYPFNKGEIFLQFLVSDPVLNLLKENSDDYQSAVPTWEDIVIKRPYTKNGFPPHQDLPMQSLIGNTFSISLYLHDSHHNPVAFLPKSHQLGPLTRDQINQLYTDHIHDFVPVKANAGDIVVHYAKTVHFSPDNFTDKPRYSWYLEFRTLEQLIQDSPWNNEWMLKRRAIFVYALEKYRPELIKDFAPDFTQLKNYLDPIQLKVPHVIDNIDFDMTSPYFHF